MEETKKVIDYIKDCNESYLSEAFKGLSLLEDDINLSNIGDDLDDELSAMVSDDVEAPVEEIVDINADEETELSDTYEGKVILECNCCHSRIYKDGEEVIIEEDTANPDDECPVCGNTCGYTVIGKIQKFDDNKEVEPEEDEDDEHEDEEEKNESLTEGAMSLKDRLARKHLFDAEESLDEEPIEESAINEDNWDKLTDAYPELENGEVREEFEESDDLCDEHDDCEEKLDEAIPADLVKAYKNVTWSDRHDDPKQTFGKYGRIDAKKKMPVTVDFENSNYTEITPQEAIQAKKDGNIDKLRVIFDDQLVFYNEDGKSLSVAYFGAGSGDKSKYQIGPDKFGYKSTQIPFNKMVNLADKIYFADEVAPNKELRAKRSDNPESPFYTRSHGFEDMPEREYSSSPEDIQWSIDQLQSDINNLDKNSENYYKQLDRLTDRLNFYKDLLIKVKNDKQNYAANLRNVSSNKALKSKYNHAGYTEDLGDDAADFLWEGNKITVDGEDYEIISMGADVLTVEDAGGQAVEFDLAELAGKPYSVVDYDGEYYEHKPSVGESLTEDDDEDICPECGKKPCDCEKHGHEHCEEGCGKRVNEAVEVHASGEDEVDVAKNDDGSMTINVGQTQVEGEAIVPLSDEDQTALEANTAEEEPAEDEFEAEEVPAEEGEAAEEETEEEAPAEEGEEENTQEESYSITNFNEHKFNDLVEGFLRKVYENVNTFETTKVQDADYKFFIEGLIKYKSGKAANTRFVFENAFFSKNGSLVMEGYNSTFSNNGKSFRIRGSLNKGNFVTESMIYNYNVKQLNEANKQETVTISGRVKAR